MRCSLGSRASQILENRERLAFSDSLSLSPFAFLCVWSLLLFLSVVVVGPRWNVATLVFPDGAARRVCVRVSSSVSDRREADEGNAAKSLPESKEGTCVVAAQWDHYCNAVSIPRAYRLISLSLSLSLSLFSCCSTDPSSSLVVRCLYPGALSFLQRSPAEALAPSDFGYHRCTGISGIKNPGAASAPAKPTGCARIGRESGKI